MHYTLFPSGALKVRVKRMQKIRNIVIGLCLAGAALMVILNG